MSILAAGISSIGLGLFFVFTGLLTLFSAIVPINVDRYRDWNVEMLFYKMYPLLVENFMGKGDCRTVHAVGNIVAPSTGGPVTHIIQGGTDLIAKAKEPVYRLRAEEGRTRIASAEQTGEFIG